MLELLTAATPASSEAVNLLDPSELWQRYQPELLAWGVKAVGALVLIIIGMRVAGWLAGMVRHQALKYESIDDTLGNFFASLVRWALTAAVFIAALQVFGVQATSFVAILGGMTLALGLAMQGALGNIASGVMIIMFRPYELGDYIEAAGVAGTVKDINLFRTVLATVDNVQILVPNSQAIDGVIKNYSGYDRRRVDVMFGIDYNDDMDKAISLVTDIIKADTRIQNDPEPFVAVTELNISSVDISTRSWVNASDYWAVKFDLIKKVKEAFDANGISIPYPHTMMVQKAAE
ncbi:MAG: mechanosensitive ion channel domain-containing protein [Pseudomonadota bacterium]